MAKKHKVVVLNAAKFKELLQACLRRLRSYEPGPAADREDPIRKKLIRALNELPLFIEEQEER